MSSEAENLEEWVEGALPECEWVYDLHGTVPVYTCPATATTRTSDARWMCADHASAFEARLGRITPYTGRGYCNFNTLTDPCGRPPTWVAARWGWVICDFHRAKHLGRET